jgi:WD40 repeat protein
LKEEKNNVTTIREKNIMNNLLTNKTFLIFNKFILYFLAGFILSIPIATKAVADNENIFLKGWHAMTNNHQERQIIRLITETSNDKDVMAVAWSPDGKSIATAGQQPESVVIWDSATLSILQQLDQGTKGWGGDNITFSPDGKYLASGLKIVNLWKVAGWTQQTTLIAPHITPGIPQDAGIKSLRFSPDGKMLVVAYTGDKEIVIAYRVADGRIAWTYEPQRIMITTPLVFTPNGKRVILGIKEYGGEDVNFRDTYRILLLDAASGKLLRSIDDIHVMEPTALAISWDGKWVATGTRTGDGEQDSQNIIIENKDPVRIWDLATGKLVKEFPVHSRIQSLAFSRDGKYLFGSKNDFKTYLTMAVWDAASGKLVQEIRNNATPMNMAVSPDGKRLAAACQHRLSVYEIKTGK